MAYFTEHKPGTPSWVDLMSKDLEASKSFYTSLFGWEAEDQFDPDGNVVYVMFKLEGKNVAGMGQQLPHMSEMPALWNMYISTDDIDATTAAVTANGGAVVMPKMQVMTSGSMAVFTDSAGAAFSVWEPGDHIGAEIGNIANTYSWSELNSRDIDAALPFYAAVFGWTYQANDLPTGTYHLIEGGTEEQGMGGAMAMPPGVPDMVPSHWATYFTVDSLDASLATVAENGGMTVMEPMAIPGIGTFAVVHDSQGANFAMMQPEDQDQGS